MGSIGVFDSGVGGLSTLHAIRQAYPDEHLIYVADSGHAPYCDQAASAVIARAQAITHFLLDAPCKAIVVACNTASVVALPALRAMTSVPIIGMEPAIKPRHAGDAHRGGGRVGYDADGAERIGATPHCTILWQRAGHAPSSTWLG